MIHIQFGLLVSIFITISLIDSLHSKVHGAVKNGDLEICDPHTMTIDEYPGVLTKIDVVATNLLKTRIHLRLINSTKEVSFEGIVFNAGFSNPEALVACRSLGCSKLAVLKNTGWIQTQACRFTCPDGTSALQNCHYMLNYLKCPVDAMSFKECTGNSWSQYATYQPQQYGVSLVCTECGED